MIEFLRFTINELERFEVDLDPTVDPSVESTEVIECPFRILNLGERFGASSSSSSAGGGGGGGTAFFLCCCKSGDALGELLGSGNGYDGWFGTVFFFCCCTCGSLTRSRVDEALVLLLREVAAFAASVLVPPCFLNDDGNKQYRT